MIEARPADPSSTSGLRRWIAPYDSFFGPTQGRPRVVAVNGQGKELVLFTKDTWDETVAARNRVRGDLVRMGPDGWARHYGAPDDFLD